MPSLTIRNIPEDTLQSIRELSEQENRSMNSQILTMLKDRVEENDFKATKYFSGEWKNKALQRETKKTSLYRKMDNTHQIKVLREKVKKMWEGKPKGTVVTPEEVDSLSFDQQT